MVLRHRRRFALAAAETLEPRFVLAAPVAVDDSYTLAEDSTVATQLALIDAHFVTSAESFTYADDAFGTNQPSLAGGTYQAAGGIADGGIRVRLEPGGTNPRSGAWANTFNLPTAATVTIDLRYRLVMGPDFENNEFAEALLSIDGTLYGTGGNNYLRQMFGALAARRTPGGNRRR